MKVKKLKPFNLKVGMMVKILRKPSSQELIDCEWKDTWVDQMDNYIGKTFEIINLNTKKVIMKNLYYWFPIISLDLNFPKVKIPKWKKYWRQ